MAAKGKVLIVGCGIAGLATAWSLVRRGFEVEMFEQGPIPNPKASSWDEHRITRHAYGEFEGYAYLMPQAFRLWDMMWKDLGVTHYDPCGAVYFVREETPWYEGTSTALTRMGIRFRDIPLSRAETRFPMLNLDTVTRVVETDGAGMLFPSRIVLDLVVFLTGRGVVFHSSHLVSEIDAERATVTANGRTFTGDRVVVAAGAWADRLVPTLRPDALPSRQAVMFLAPPADHAHAWAEASVMADLGEESSCYMLPPRRGTRLKIGDHVFTRRGDADEDRTATDLDVQRLTRVLKRVVKDFDRYQVLERKACFYTVTDDEHFIQRAVGSKGWIISACSGHGFKLGALTGELAAQAISGERGADEVTHMAAGLVMEPT
ncbi:MAG: FAD-dependent oxidoreductase [Proteobacteria bacterium]|nr:FAD-dependent oxidoreductase [Pseudomonadota bacterium]